MKKATDKDTLDKVNEGFRRVGLTFPHFAGLIARLDVRVDRRVGTMGVFASGRLAVNPEFVQSLSTRDLIFVLSHELYHLTLRTHERGEGTDPADFNKAHDYIINDMLREELQAPEVPAGGLDWPGARLLSAEKILGEIERNGSSQQGGSWQPQSGQGQGRRGNRGELADAHGDVLDDDTERRLFPETQTGEQEVRAAAVREQAEKAMTLGALMESMRGPRGHEAGGMHNTVDALRGLYRPPWELALQRWLESVAPSERSYARPSRRGADRSDVVLAGRKREGWTLHIVLDTSGSMADEVPRALGAIADFCDALGVDRVHLVQCDTEVGSDEVVTPAELGRWQVTGYGGSDLTPAMLRLADDSDVQAAIVLTDGDIEYPQEAMPYAVLWVMPAWKDPRDFTPRYGKVIGMTT